ncbi:alpha/beta fold hydrolase [Microbacterium album]|uniref:AB hydrolase-1 domain-containing protein n=1 Tax=Microbacterium album TaxID=2053191 RepID=A0A917ML43_9MICO|nr:alpha/beta hydrolase [Microbacterium album]GGH35932.1 hypothetical protein GCM10010921_04750 [Microbacterium album]
MPTARLVDLDGHVFRILTSAEADTGRRATDGSQLTFLLVHGIGISHRLFSRLHAVLSEHHTVHSVDLPGFGGMPKPPTSPDVPEMAAWLGRVLDRVGTGPVIPIGVSMGTQWSVELATQRPDLVPRVVTIGPVVDERYRNVIAQSVALGNDCLRESPSANARVLTEYLRCGPVWYFRQLPHMLEYPMEERVAALRQPLLVLRGGRDPIAGPEWCGRLRDRASHARLVEVPGHPHLVQHTAPRAVAGAVRWFARGEDRR